MAGQTAGESCARAALQPLPDFLQFHYPLAGSIFSQGERKKRKNTPLPVAQRRRRPCAARRWAPPFSRHWYPNPPLFFLPARLIFVSFVLQVAGLFFSLFFFPFLRLECEPSRVMERHKFLFWSWLDVVRIILCINLGTNCCFLKPFDFGFSVLYWCDKHVTEHHNMTTLQGWAQQFRHSADIKIFGSNMALHGTHKAFSFQCFAANGRGFGADSTNKRKVGSFNATFPSLFPSICSILHAWQALVWEQRQKWNHLPTLLESRDS